MTGKSVFGILCLVTLGAFGFAVGQAPGTSGEHKMIRMDDAQFRDWLSRWERNIINSDPRRYCTTEMGEEIGWRMQPFLKGFYYGYLTTGNTKWIDMLVKCTDAWVDRAVMEPDGYLGWPKIGAA